MKILVRIKIFIDEFYLLFIYSKNNLKFIDKVSFSNESGESNLNAKKRKIDELNFLSEIQCKNVSDIVKIRRTEATSCNNAIKNNGKEKDTKMTWQASLVLAEFLKVPEQNIITCFQQLQITADRIK